MQKTAVTITVTTLVLGIFGAFLRWLQLMNAFDADGFPVRGAGTTVVFLIYCILAVAALCVLSVLWLGRYDCDKGAQTALQCANAVPFLLGWVLCVAAAAASCALMFSAGTSHFPLLQRLFGAFGIVAALATPWLFGKKGGSGAGAMGRAAAVVVTLFDCFWLMFSYKSNAVDPITWHFAVEVLAIAATTVALYYVTTFFYGVGKATRTLIALQLGAFLSVTALFEQRGTALNVLFGVAAALQLLLEFLLISNLREKRD